MRIVLVGALVGVVLALAGCASLSGTGPGSEAPDTPAETHVCTQSPDGLAECRPVAPS